MALSSTQTLTEMCNRNNSWMVKAPLRRANNLTTFMCRLSWNLGDSSFLNPTYILVFLPPHNVSSPFFTWFSHLRLILNGRTPKFLSSLAVLTVSIVPSAISSLIFDYLCLRSSSIYLCFSGHFKITWNSMRFALLHGAQGASATLRAPLALLSWQVPSLNHATPLMSIIKQQDTHTFRPQQCFISPHNDKNILSLIVASRLCFWISERLRLTTWHVVLISVCPAFLLNFRNINSTSLIGK